MARTTAGLNQSVSSVTGVIDRIVALNALPNMSVTGALPAGLEIARATIAIAAPANGVSGAITPSPVDIAMPAAAAPLYLGYIRAVDSFLWEVQPLGGRDRKYTRDATANTFRSTAHGYANGDRVVFYGSAGAAAVVPGGGLTAGTIYFVVGATADTFQVATTSGGAAIVLTATAASESAVVSRIVPQTFPDGGTLRVTAAQLNALL